MDIHLTSGNHRHIGMYYVATLVGGTLTVNTEEHYDAKWFTADEVKGLKTTDAMKVYARIAIKEVAIMLKHGYPPTRYIFGEFE